MSFVNRLMSFTDAELKVLSNAIAFALQEGELADEDCAEIRNEIDGECYRREELAA